MTRAFDMRQITVEDTLSAGDLQTVPKLATKDVGRCTILAGLSETDARGHNLWHMLEVRR